ncbi:DUF2239 family protein [Deinococcus sp. Arct2-2]|uniref:DUF2239 family protein n=1 Tax=Deinococcus sp. Arct2-2 TaxID=2568653 RepID=UPI0010A41156|nr:DUF2239 family protein [Deinococcus sp. Arct2-2]THF70259.1 DUF2239 family protein [Deinococcus sp. Arct2-2]
MDELPTYTAFHGSLHLLTGSLHDVLTELKTQADSLDAASSILIFEDRSGRQADFNLRGTLSEVLEREAPLPSAPASAPAKAGPGRPKLGIVSREISLLPRHWDWLELQRGGASATLRRLVDEARKQNPGQERVQQAQAAADRFLGAMAGNLPHFEAASRALYARDQAGFVAHSADWPADIRRHALHLAAPVFADPSGEGTPSE